MKNKMMPRAMIIMGMGLGAYMLYKNNPDMMCEMKNKIKNMAYRIADSLEDMTEDM